MLHVISRKLGKESRGRREWIELQIRQPQIQHFLLDYLVPNVSLGTFTFSFQNSLATAVQAVCERNSLKQSFCMMRSQSEIGNEVIVNYRHVA